MKDCIFCKIVTGGIPAPKLFEDADFVCIRDIYPQSQTHLLLFPKEHIVSLSSFFSEQTEKRQLKMGRYFDLAVQMARQNGLEEKGFRTVFNTGPYAGQTVFHIHLHILGGEPLGKFGAEKF